MNRKTIVFTLVLLSVMVGFCLSSPCTEQTDGTVNAEVDVTTDTELFNALVNLQDTVINVKGNITIDTGITPYVKERNTLKVTSGFELTINGGIEIFDNGKLVNEGVLTNNGKIIVKTDGTLEDTADGLDPSVTLDNQGTIEVFGKYISHFGGETLLIGGKDSGAIIMLETEGSSEVICERVNSNMVYTVKDIVSICDNGKTFLFGGDKLIVDEYAEVNILDFTLVANPLTQGLVELENNGKVTVTGSATFTNKGKVTNNGEIAVSDGGVFEDMSGKITGVAFDNKGTVDVHGKYIRHNTVLGAAEYFISNDANDDAIITIDTIGLNSHVECTYVNDATEHTEYTIYVKATIKDSSKRFLSENDVLNVYGYLLEIADVTIEDLTVPNTAKLVNDGNITVTGTLTNNGEIENNYYLTNNGVTTNNGKITVSSGATIEDKADGVSAVTLNNQGNIDVYGTYFNYFSEERTAVYIISDDSSNEAIITIDSDSGSYVSCNRDKQTGNMVYTLYGKATIDDNDALFLLNGDKLVVDKDAEATVDEFTLEPVTTGTVELVNEGKIIVNMTLVNESKIVNEGTIEVGWNGVLTNNGEIVNNKNMTSNGKIVNEGTITNTGSFINDEKGTFDNNDTLVNKGASSTFTNKGIIENEGTITNNLGTFVNSGTMKCSGRFTNDSGTFANEGVVTCTGTITNKGVAINVGTINITGTSAAFDNTNGLMINCCAFVPVHAVNTLTFVTNDSSFGAIEINEILYSSGKVTVTANETAPHKFSHWTNGVSKETTKTISVFVDKGKEVTWTAVFDNGAVTVTFDPNGGSTPSSETMMLTPGSPYGELPTTEWAGYEFAGWYTAAEGGELVTKDSIVPNNSHTLYAHWTAKEITVTFDSTGGSETTPKTKTVVFNSEYGELPTTKKTGSTFIGWYTEDGNLITAESIVTISDNHALYAHWESDSITIKFDANGPEISVAEKVVKIGEAYGTLPELTWEYFEFIGWYTAKVGGERITESTIVTVTEDQTLYAIWANVDESVDDDGSKTKTESWEGVDEEGRNVVVTVVESIATDGAVTESKSLTYVIGKKTYTDSSTTVTDGSGNFVSETVSNTVTSTVGSVTTISVSTVTTNASGEMTNISEDITITETSANSSKIETTTVVIDKSGTKKIENASTVTKVSAKETRIVSETTVMDKNDSVLSIVSSDMTTTSKSGNQGETEDGFVTYKNSEGKVLVIEQVYRDTTRGVTNGATVISVSESITLMDSDESLIKITVTNSKTTVNDDGDTIVSSTVTVTYPDESEETMVSLKVTDKDYKVTSTAFKFTDKDANKYNLVITTYNDVEKAESGAAKITTEVLDKAIAHSKAVSDLMKLTGEIDRIVNFNSTGDAYAVASELAFKAIKNNGVGIAVTGSDNVTVVYSNETLKSISGNELYIHAYLNSGLSKKQKEVISDRSYVTVDSSSRSSSDADSNIVVSYVLNNNELIQLSSANNIRIVPAMVTTDGTVVKEGLSANVDLKTGLMTIVSENKDVSQSVAYFVYIEYETPSSEPSNTLGFAFALFIVVVVLLVGTVAYLKQKTE